MIKLMEIRNMNSILLILTLASFTVLLTSQITTSAYADVVSPSKQVKIGLDKTDIVCKAHLVKVYRINADSLDCFTPKTAEKLIERGLAKDIPKDKLETKKTFRQNSPIGTITGFDVVKKFGSEGRMSTELRTVEYLYVFEVCAMEKTIRAPEILLTSDSQAKTVKLANKINANTCSTNTASIKATTPTSISASLTNKGVVTDKVTELEKNVADLQQKLSDLKKTFPKSGTTLDDASMVSNTSDQIIKLRAELNLAKSELNKYLYTLHSPQLPSSQFAKQKLSFTGVPLEGSSVKVLTISKQTAGNINESAKGGVNLFNVVFEACSGNDVIRAPEVRIKSDSQEKTIAIAERIIANSCQMSAGKINAVDTSSITLSMANRDNISAKIVELESTIGMLLDEQVTHQNALNKLVVLSEKPDNYEQQVSELSGKIIQLRNDMRDLKFELYGNLYQIYNTQQ